MSKKSNRKGAIALLLLSGGLSLLLAEVVVRVVLPHPAYYTGHPGNVPGLVTPHSVRHYTWTPGFRGRMSTADFDTEYVISEQGLRDDTVADTAATRILAIGDSFTAGEGVDASETWPAQLQTLLSSADEPVRVINAAVTGYGAKQMRQMAEELVPEFLPQLVILGAFPQGADRVDNPFVLFNGHLVRSAQREHMQAHGDGFLWYHSGLYRPWAARVHLWTQRYFHLGAYLIEVVQALRSDRPGAHARTPAPGPEADVILAPLYAELIELRRYLADRDIPLLVLVVSGQSADGSFSEENRRLAARLRAFSEERDIPVVEPLPALDAAAAGRPIMRFPGDAHWTPRAQHLAAREVAKAVRELYGAGANVVE